MLRFFQWVGRAKPVFLVLTIVAAVNTCLYFFVHQAYLEAPSGQLSPARTTAPGEPTGGMLRAGEPTGGVLRTAPKSVVSSPEGITSDAETTKAEGSSEGSGSGSGGDQKPAVGKSSRSTSATAMPPGSHAPLAAGAAQYASAGAAQYATASATAVAATAEASPGGGFLPPGIGQLRKIPKRTSRGWGT
jgi:hypothetical protein